MRICHITPHLPPDQAANALLPCQLAMWARDAGDEPTFVAHPPRASDRAPAALPGGVIWIPRRRRGGIMSALTLSSAGAALGIASRISPAVRKADVVHIHSNGLLAETGAWVAGRLGKPYILTLYGTEIWHYAPRRLGVDLFTRAYRQAHAITFYSRGLLDKASELGLARARMTVIYPPVTRDFHPLNPDGRRAARAALGIDAEHLLVNVKRLHPLAGHHTLLDAMPAVVSVHPGTHLVVCGTGPLADTLAARSRTLRLERHVTFAGLVDNHRVAQYDMAADAFVLPSLLEACPTVAVESLACGTPVISTDNPGGVELNGLFGDDVTVVPRSDPASLGQAIVDFLAGKRRTRDATTAVLEQQFNPDRVSARFRALYRQALGTRAEDR